MDSVLLSDIKKTCSCSVLSLELIGIDSFVTGVSAAEDCQTGDITFVSNQRYLDIALQRSPAALVVSKNLADAVSQIENMGILITNNVKLAHALIKQAYADRDFLDKQWGQIHPSAVIHKTANIPESCFIGPNVVVGANTVLGERCRVLAGAVIENDVQIGNDGVFHPNCVIGYKCQLGNDVEIGSCTVIGAEGFGFAQDAAGKSYKIPQTGIVVIEDNVLLGAFNTIDRATYGVTKIGSGTKTDNIVHIAHNCTIGKDCLFTPMLAVAGSTTFGDRCMTSGQTQTIDHVNICDDVVLLHRAGVTKDITEAGSYSAMPIQPFKKHIKNISHVNKLTEMNKKMRVMEKMLQQLMDEK